jgi:hypothetical protein
VRAAARKLLPITGVYTQSPVNDWNVRCYVDITLRGYAEAFISEMRELISGPLCWPEQKALKAGIGPGKGKLMSLRSRYAPACGSNVRVFCAAYPALIPQRDFPAESAPS